MKMLACSEGSWYEPAELIELIGHYCSASVNITNRHGGCKIELEWRMLTINKVS
jgi:hypothetical protein